MLQLATYSTDYNKISAAELSQLLISHPWIQPERRTSRNLSSLPLLKQMRLTLTKSQTTIQLLSTTTKLIL